MSGDLRAARAAGPAPADAKCAECGARIPIGARYCPMCGLLHTVDAPPSARSIGVVDGLKFGLGLAIAAALVALLVWVGFMLISNAMGLVSGPVDSTFNGSGSVVTESFRLSGDVDVTWSANPLTPDGCRHTATVYIANQPGAREVIADQQIGVATTGQYTLRGLADDRYVAEVASGCQWSFRFSPR